MALRHVDAKLSVTQYLLSIVRRSCMELYGRVVRSSYGVSEFCESYWKIIRLIVSRV